MKHNHFKFIDGAGFRSAAADTLAALFPNALATAVEGSERPVYQLVGYLKAEDVPAPKPAPEYRWVHATKELRDKLKVGDVVRSHCFAPGKELTVTKAYPNGCVGEGADCWEMSSPPDWMIRQEVPAAPAPVEYDAIPLDISKIKPGTLVRTTRGRTLYSVDAIKLSYRNTPIFMLRKGSLSPVEIHFHEPRDWEIVTPRLAPPPAKQAVFRSLDGKHPDEGTVVAKAAPAPAAKTATQVKAEQAEEWEEFTSLQVGDVVLSTCGRRFTVLELNGGLARPILLSRDRRPTGWFAMENLRGYKRLKQQEELERILPQQLCVGDHLRWGESKMDYWVASIDVLAEEFRVTWSGNVGSTIRYPLSVLSRTEVPVQRVVKKKSELLGNVASLLILDDMIPYPTLADYTHQAIAKRLSAELDASACRSILRVRW